MQAAAEASSATVLHSTFTVQGYLKSIPGIARISLIALSLVCFISVLCNSRDAGRSEAGFFLFVCIGGLALNGLFLFLTLLRISARVPYLPLAELLFGALWAFFYLLGSSLLLARANGVDGNKGPWVAAGVFGLMAFAAYLVDVAMSFLRWKITWASSTSATPPVRFEASNSTGVSPDDAFPKF